MIKWHAYVVHMAKHINMVGAPCLVRGPGPGRLETPKSGADEWAECN